MAIGGMASAYPRIPGHEVVGTVEKAGSESCPVKVGQFKDRGIKIVYRSLNPTPKNTRIGMVEGDMDRGYVSVGNGITHIHEIKSAQEIIDELTADWS